MKLQTKKNIIVSINAFVHSMLILGLIAFVIIGIYAADSIMRDVVFTQSDPIFFVTTTDWVTTINLFDITIYIDWQNIYDKGVEISNSDIVNSVLHFAQKLLPIPMQLVKSIIDMIAAI